MSQKIFDFIVIGAGISGASVAYELAESGTVALLEAESAPGYHSTGRSAALFTPNFGSPEVCEINKVSEAFFLNPPDGFCETPLLSPRGALTVARSEDDYLSSLLQLSSEQSPIYTVSKAEALELAPILKPELVHQAVYEPNVSDIDVATLHQGYLRGFKQRKGELLIKHKVVALEYKASHWQVNAGGEVYQCKQVINASGAWADQLGALAKAKPIGLVPKRRTAIIVKPPEGLDLNAMPLVDFVGGAYLKPEAGNIMVSPGDETPVEPQDIQPDDLEIAVLVDWLEKNTLITVDRLEHSWAGLRSFVEDQNPVIRYDHEQEGFFWLAAQGGYGIMMAPTLAKRAASLLLASG